MTILLSLFTLVALGGPGRGAHPTAAVPTDSIGMEMRGGQRFVKHRVGSGETLFALARRYRVSVDQLTAANPQLANGLGIGQVVLVPRPAPGKAGGKTWHKIFPLREGAISTCRSNQAVRFPTRSLAGKRWDYFDAAIHASIFCSNIVSGKAPVFKT